MKNWDEITKTRRLDMLERVVFPAIGKLPVREITPHHILKILQETAKIVVARTWLTIACGLCGGHWRVLQKPPKHNGQISILITPCGPFWQRE